MIGRADLRRRVRHRWLEAFTPPEHLTVSEWADRYRYLSPESAAVATNGPFRWSTAYLPYLREIMDSLSRPDVREVVLAKSAQVGGSAAGENWFGWITDHRPGPTLIVWPTEKKFRAFALTRLDPMIRDTPQLAAKFPRSGRRSSDDSISIKRFHGGYLQNLTAKSTADLRSFSARNVDCEEVDEWEVDLKDQGEPLGLVQARVIAFGADYTIFYVSTPSIEGRSRIWPLLEASSDARYHVPCPHCNGFQVLEWQTDAGELRFRWEVDAAGAPIGDSVRYGCALCQRDIPFAARDAMVEAGRWVHRFPGRSRVGYHIWSAYSRFVSWAKLAEVHWDARESPQKRKTFTNLWLGRCYKSEGKTIEPHFLQQRAETFAVSEDGELLAPLGVALLTAFVDVQVDRLEVFVEGWGAGEENWKLDWTTIDGDPGQPEPWQELEALLTASRPHASGHRIRIVSTAVDANYQKKAVHAFTDRLAGLGVFPTIGKGGRGRQLLQEPGAPKSKKARSQWKPVWVIGTDTAKDKVWAALSRLPPGPGTVHFSDRLDTAYYDGLTAETLETGYVRGRPELVWTLKPGRRNEPFDAAAGNRAALERLGPKTIASLGLLAEQLRTTPVTATEPSPVAAPARRVRHPGLRR